MEALLILLALSFKEEEECGEEGEEGEMKEGIRWVSILYILGMLMHPCKLQTMKITMGGVAVNWTSLLLAFLFHF